jgi:predicted dehydrogenase
MARESRLRRRDFVRRSVAAAGAAAAGAIVGRAHAAGGDTIKLALIGCGGRGTGAVTQALRAGSGSIKLWAMADLFPDQIDRALALLTKGTRPRDDYEAHGSFGPAQIDVAPQRRFVGFDAYHKAIESGADLVFLTTPPGFRPLHYAAAVAAGRNVFMEKPCCVDAPGFRCLMESNKLAQQKGLKVGVGLQRRHSPAYREILQRLHDGAIGEVKCQQAYFNCGGSWTRPRHPGESEMAFQIRNFQYFVWLGGDVIVEAHVHNLDACNWVVGDHPVEANGMGGRQIPADAGHGQTFDHHFVEFTYANGVKLFSQCRYIPGCWDRCGEVVTGTKGQALMSGWGGGEGDTSLSGEKPWRYRGLKVNAWEQEHADLIVAVRQDRPYHEGWYGATSSFTGVLGRMATYSGQIVRWDDAVAKGRDEMPRRLALDADPPVRPDAGGHYATAIPGVTKAY